MGSFGGVSAGIVFNEFYNYTSLATEGHGPTCLCDLCLGTLTLFTDGSGFYENEAGGYFEFFSKDEAVRQFRKLSAPYAKALDIRRAVE